MAVILCLCDERSIFHESKEISFPAAVGGHGVQPADRYRLCSNPAEEENGFLDFLFGEKYTYLYAALTWDEYWANEKVYAAGNAAASAQLDSHEEHDLGAYRFRRYPHGRRSYRCSRGRTGKGGRMMEKTQTKPLTAAQQRQRDKKRRTWLRAGVQLFFFVSMPGAFVAGFSGVKQIFLHIGAGEVLSVDSFTLSLMGLCGFTLLFDRFFCGYACAFGSLGDAVWALSGLIQKKLFHRKKTAPSAGAGGAFGARRSNTCCWHGW